MKKVCKKSYSIKRWSNAFNYDNIILATKGKDYEIFEEGNDTDSYYIKSDNVDYSTKFYLPKEYFYTEKELRKMKLKKINNGCL
jgi:hypothetical protein